MRCAGSTFAGWGSATVRENAVHPGVVRDGRGAVGRGSFSRLAKPAGAEGKNVRCTGTEVRAVQIPMLAGEARVGTGRACPDLAATDVLREALGYGWA